MSSTFEIVAVVDDQDVEFVLTVNDKFTRGKINQSQASAVVRALAPNALDVQIESVRKL